MTGVELIDIAYGGETVGRLPTGYVFPNERPKIEAVAPPPLPEEDETVDISTLDTQEPEIVVAPNAGPVIFVAGGVPGERVTVQLFRRQKSFWRGKVTQIEQAAPERTTAPCPYFGVDKWPNCGGCQWQHTDYAAQVRFKDKILRDQLERIGGIANPPMREPVAAINPWRYRNNAEFQVDRVTNRPCYHRQNSIRLVPIESCDIVHPAYSDCDRAVGRRISAASARQNPSGDDPCRQHQ